VVCFIASTTATTADDVHFRALSLPWIQGYPALATDPNSTPLTNYRLLGSASI
jgi:hypothetical protein